MAKKQHYMTYAERVRLEEKLRYKVKVSRIARELEFSRQAIYDEIERGSYLHNCGWYDEERYSADKGQAVHDKNQQNKTGRELKIGKDRELADFLEKKMLGIQEDGKADRSKRYSPAAALELARREGFKTTICVSTLYSYIDMGLFVKLTNADLLEKPGRKPKKEGKERRVAHPALPSIENRPQEINERAETGHKEMDLIVGKEGSKAAMLTLTDRKGRTELAFKIPDKRAASVRAVFDKLERKLGKRKFRKMFRSITTDNGPEFLEYEELTKSVFGGQRFTVYYCHSYASWEKGTNENHNRFMRRFFPKGTDFTKISQKQIREAVDFMNHYPRKILGWKMPAEIV